MGSAMRGGLARPAAGRPSAIRGANPPRARGEIRDLDGRAGPVSDDPVCDDADNDFVRDTWPQRSYLFLRDVDCANPPTTCARSGRPDQLTNIMQYSPCVTAENGTFTPGQLRRMQWKLVQERPGLLRESP